MPSLSDIQLQAGFVCTQAVHGETVTIMTGICANKTYQATVLVVQDLVLDMEVTRDMREKVTMHFPDNNWPIGVKPEDLVNDGYGITWVFGKRTNNPHDNTVDFECKKYVKQS
jgi:hypothetical protein